MRMYINFAADFITVTVAQLKEKNEQIFIYIRIGH